MNIFVDMLNKSQGLAFLPAVWVFALSLLAPAGVAHAGSTSGTTYDAQGERKVSVEEDFLFVESNGEVDTRNGEYVSSSLYDYFTIDSGSLPAITISGLPTGLKYDKKTGLIAGQTKKTGVYYVTCSVKNKLGYQMSAMARWTVGGAGDGDYDDIGLSSWVDLEELDNLCVGRPFEACGFYVSSVSGLPTGLKFVQGSICSGGACTECSGFIMGTPTKAGKFRITFTDSLKRKTVKTVVVADGGSAYLSVNVGDGCQGMGTVSGGGLKRAGATVSLSARPKSGYYFAGWYTDCDCAEEFQSGKSGDYRTANETFVFDAEDVPELYARFVSKYEDLEINVYGDDVWNVHTEYGADAYRFEVDSKTLAKVTAKGLPAGVKLSGSTLVISDTSKLRPGTSVATLTAKNLSGATRTKNVRIVVPNLRSRVFDGLEYESAYLFTVGEMDTCRAFGSFSVDEGWTVTASGLPPGLKFNFGKDVGYAYLSGRATKAGVYTVTLTAKRGRETEKATFTAEVNPFPAEAVGTYGGDIGYGLEDGESEDGIGYDIYRVGGSFSMTIAKDGKISVKFPANGKTVGLSGYSCAVTEEEIYAYLSDAKGKNWCSLSIYPQRTLGACQVEGSFGTPDSEWSALGQRNVAKTDAQMKAMAAKLSKIGKIQGLAFGGSIDCPNCIDLRYVTTHENIAFTVGSDGMVRASGKIDGRSVSGTALLQTRKLEDDDYWLYADFYDYKSSTGLLVYRAVFQWSWLRDYNPSAWGALCGGSYYFDGGGVACKPVIYLYPEAETVCSVGLELNGRFTCTYPAYGRNGWRDFVASPDGTLTFQDGKQYYCLYWEGHMAAAWDFSHGYCVSGSETATFLAHVLLEIGLDFREANEFIIYWLPLMQDNSYNIIAFQGENYANAAKLDVEPQPDSVLRVFMAWRPSSQPLEIPAPVIEPFERKGFAVVEWGGMKVCE